jgi:signal transduction histidine kinase
MPSNPWLALDVKTSPEQRARELRRVWDDFLGDGRVDAARRPIADSWQRSQAAGIDPTFGRVPTMVSDRRDVAERWRDHPLVAAAPLVRESLGVIADESDNLIVVSDADGLLLWIEGSAKVRSAAADAMNFTEGALWSEGGAGTNAIGTALAADHPVQVHAAEHFNEMVHGWTCAAAPVHDPDSGRLLGIVDLTGPMNTAHPHSFAVALGAARAIEMDLRARLQVRDELLRARHLGRTSSREQRALVSSSGRVIADHPGGFLRVEHIDVPPGGGEVVLPSGLHVFAEPVGIAGDFLVRARPERHASHAWTERTWARVRTGRFVSSVTRPVTERMRAHLELTWLAEEQAALRRVTMLVADQAAADEIFAAVAEEVAQLLGAERGTVCRYEADETMTVLAYWSNESRKLPVGTNVALEGDSIAATVRRSGGPGRLDSYEGLSGPVVDAARALGAMPGSTVGAPIVVAGRVWGTVLASSTKSGPLPDGAESRIMGFAELVATAISNAIGRAELDASRARVVKAADDTRRRIERDLHDGAQQRLVALALQLRTMEAKVPMEQLALRADLSRAARGLADAVEDLHEISRGLRPAILSNGGLGPALRRLCGRAAVPVVLDVASERRWPESVEVAAYYVVSEALTNVAKHAQASVVTISVDLREQFLQIAIQDDGVGGADPSRGSGLVGLRDRVEGMGGRLLVESPMGAGTSLRVLLPATGRPAAEGSTRH